MKLKDCAPLMFLHSPLFRISDSDCFSPPSLLRSEWGVCQSHAGFSRKERPQAVATVACSALLPLPPAALSAGSGRSRQKQAAAGVLERPVPSATGSTGCTGCTGRRREPGNHSPNPAGKPQTPPPAGSSEAYGSQMRHVVQMEACNTIPLGFLYSFTVCDQFPRKLTDDLLLSI